MAQGLRWEFPEYAVLMEEPVRYEDEQGRMRCAVTDIMIWELGVIYRLNGAIHNSSVQEKKDWEQKIYLEQLGYLVIDIDT
jgi:very-short-patch-repair endonuclease